MSDRPIIVTDPDATANERSTRRIRNHSGGSPNIVVTLLLIVAVTASVVLGYFVWTLFSLLHETNATLGEAANRIEQLQSQMALTSSNLTESGRDTEESLNYWETETRKLWDKSYKFDEQFQEQGEDIAALEQRFGSVQGSMTDLENSITTLSRQQQDLIDSINTSNQVTASLTQKVDAHIRKTDDAINAQDQSRISNSSRLVDMDRRLRALETGN
ncbi:MAG: hypothetical protein OXG08_00085 [Gammaproteobacteria bacterium]|nr:hypothetical protein [Gammaproteobacteria bacterium]